MITKTINLYSLDELSEKAKEKAHDDYLEMLDFPLLSEEMTDRLEILLLEKGIKWQEIKEKTGIWKNRKVHYSLSHSQGDGTMFTGRFYWKDKTITISHSGHYYHSYSKNIYIEDEEGNLIDDENDEFEKIYQSICKELENIGYSHIESETSFETFKENSELNGWTYREDGTSESL